MLARTALTGSMRMTDGRSLGCCSTTAAGAYFGPNTVRQAPRRENLPLDGAWESQMVLGVDFVLEDVGGRNQCKERGGDAAWLSRGPRCGDGEFVLSTAITGILGILCVFGWLFVLFDRQYFSERCCLCSAACWREKPARTRTRLNQ